ncbi:alpha/beta hydrolase family protein [Flavobacterium microcysteis]
MYIKIKTIIFCLLAIHSLLAQKAKIEPLPQQPYDKYEIKNPKDTLTFYLSVATSKEKLPLVVYIQGSGMSSQFAVRNDKIIPTNGHMTWFDAGQEKCKILIVEKPGVKYLQQGESENFDKKFSLESWSNTIVSAVNYVIKNENIDSRKILIAGHSEGGIVASRVANLMKGTVTNVAILAGEGPSQLYSLYKFAEDGTFFNTKEHNMPTSEQRIDYVKNEWNSIQSDPNNTLKKFWGFTYLRWSSMLKTSVIDELENYNGKILLLQGTADKAVYPESATIAYTTLLSKGKNISLELIKNADHSFTISDQPKIDGWKMVIEKTLQWFKQ